jgi:cysteinyl-tRNA synthetase
MHNNFLIERSGKMSKSSGEFLRVQLLIDKGFHPLAYRLMCLQAHYRSELEFSWEGLQAALVRLKRMVMAVTALKARHAELVSASYLSTSETKTLKQVQGDVNPAIAAALADFEAALSDDLNTAVVIMSLETLIGLKKVDVAQQRAAIADVDSVLGLNLLTLDRADLRIRPKAAIITEAEIETALLLRKEARAAKDFAKSDAIRDELIAKGVEVMDGDPLGWDWKLDV